MDAFLDTGVIFSYYVPDGHHKNVLSFYNSHKSEINSEITCKRVYSELEGIQHKIRGYLKDAGQSYTRTDIAKLSSVMKRHALGLISHECFSSIDEPLYQTIHDCLDSEFENKADLEIFKNAVVWGIRGNGSNIPENPVFFTADKGDYFRDYETWTKHKLLELLKEYLLDKTKYSEDELNRNLVSLYYIGKGDFKLYSPEGKIKEL
ncbi:hypothetical protein [Methanococcus maripaludis]|uniref:Uncharacterized protein n=1 Tax=Methanococcus maripaludis TaxID=39152 RepID=A0A8T4H8J7_METMI|nr:hypothetical protein [Methanococcus maripaludis]MBM7408448.1 hypothetical protein [Methanococcus maripaludis]MBP2220244.1 hypothetical protein [Methanococcus maripaludis]